MCTVFTLLQYFGKCIAHLINILENRPIIMLNAFANLLCLKLCRHNWRKPNSAACTRFTYEIEFKYTYACSGRESYISSTKSKTKLFSNKNFSLIESESTCDNFKCYSLNVVHACSIVVHKWV